LGGDAVLITRILVRRFFYFLLVLIIGMAYNGVKRHDLFFDFKDHGVHDEVLGNSEALSLSATIEAYSNEDNPKGCDEIGWNRTGFATPTQEQADEYGVCFRTAQADIRCFDLSAWTMETDSPLAAGQKLFACGASVWNDSAETVVFSPNDFTLVANDGQRFKQGASDHDDVLSNPRLHRSEVKPGESAQGEIYFLTSSSVAAPFLIEWHPNILEQRLKGVFIVDELDPLDPLPE
jgi:hypothetical protein